MLPDYDVPFETVTEAEAKLYRKAPRSAPPHPPERERLSRRQRAANAHAY